MSFSLFTRALASSMLCCALGATVATAQDAFPSKPIKIVVPIAPGGATDTQARAMAEELQKRLKVSVVVENKPGGNFVIGNVAVATAPPDGYTIGWALSAAMALNPLLYKNLAYKPQEFQLLAPVSKGHHVIAIPAAAKANNLKEWIDEIKAAGKPASVGVSSTGGTTHLMSEVLGERAGFAVQPIVYRGEAPAVLDLIANQLPAMSGVVASVLEHYKSGKVKILAISSERRIPELPNVPTFKELGYDFVVTYWNGMVAPPGTPKPVADVLSKAIQEVVASPEFKARISASVPDMQLVPGPAQVMKDMVNADQQFWSRIITSRNIRVEN